MKLDTEASTRRRLARIASVVFVVASVTRLTMFFYTKAYENPGVSEIRRVALSVGRDGTVGDPYVIPTGPTAHMMPLYPILGGTLYRVFGSGEGGEIALGLFNILVSSLQYALLPVVASLCGLPYHWGVAGALAGALVPVSFLTEIRSVESLTGCVFLLAAILALRTWRSKDLGIRSGLTHGATWGILLLVNATMLPVLGAWAVILFFARPQQRRQAGWFLLAVLVSLSAVLAPWVMRNHNIFGRIVVLRTNFGLELRVSNTDGAAARFEDNVRRPGYQKYHPSMSLEQARRLMTLGEVAFNEGEMAEAARWIYGNAGRFTQLTATRIVYFWFPNPGRMYQAPIMWLITALGFLGMYRMARENRTAAIFIGGIWLSFPAVYYVVQSSSRYRLPILWSILLASGGGLSAVLEFAKRRFGR